MKLKFIFFFSLVLLSSCGSFEEEKKRLMSDTEKKDLVNMFDIE